MSKFNAGAIEALEFDFQQFGGPQGVIKEPTTQQVDDYNFVIEEIREELRAQVRERGGSDKEAAEVAQGLDIQAMRDQANEYTGRVLDATDALCSGFPSRQNIEDLPYRVQMAFAGWLAGELNPKDPLSVMTSSRETNSTG